MKKILISLVLAAFLFAPVFTSAQTIPTQAELTQQLIQVLTQLIAQLEQEIQQILALQQSKAPTPIPTPTPTSISTQTPVCPQYSVAVCGTNGKTYYGNYCLGYNMPSGVMVVSQGACAVPTPVCNPSWQCNAWSNCANSQQTRTCSDSNNCNTANGEPAISQSCTSICSPNWQLGTWGTCINGTQTRTLTDSNNCGITTNEPTAKQSCTPTCISFTYSVWSACNYSGTQIEAVVSSSPTGCTGGNPVLSQTCTYVAPTPACIPNWQCSGFGTCINNQQTQTCNDLNNCGVTTGMPPTTQSCTNPISNANPPVISFLEYSPASPIMGQTVLIHAGATADYLLASTKIYLDGVDVLTCDFTGRGFASADCPFETTTLSIGSHTYYATTTDSSNNTTRDPIMGTMSLTVAPAPTSNANPPAFSYMRNWPSSPIVGQSASIGAVATDDYLLANTKLYLDGVNVQTCDFSGRGFRSADCSFSTTTLSVGDHTYYAVTANSFGNTTRGPLEGTMSFTVAPAPIQ